MKYILGIGGSGMSSIAKYLVQQNIDVAGYDQRKSFITNQLNQDGIKVDFNLSNLKYSKKYFIFIHQLFQLTKQR